MVSTSDPHFRYRCSVNLCFLALSIFPSGQPYQRTIISFQETIHLQSRSSIPPPRVQASLTSSFPSRPSRFRPLLPLLSSLTPPLALASSNPLPESPSHAQVPLFTNSSSNLFKSQSLSPIGQPYKTMTQSRPGYKEVSSHECNRYQVMRCGEVGWFAWCG